MEKRGVIDENTPAQEPARPCCGGKCSEKKAMEKTADAPGASTPGRAADVAAEAFRSKILPVLVLGLACAGVVLGPLLLFAQSQPPNTIAATVPISAEMVGTLRVMALQSEVYRDSFYLVQDLMTKVRLVVDDEVFATPDQLDRLKDLVGRRVRVTGTLDGVRRNTLVVKLAADPVLYSPDVGNPDNYKGELAITVAHPSVLGLVESKLPGGLTVTTRDAKAGTLHCKVAPGAKVADIMTALGRLDLIDSVEPTFELFTPPPPPPPAPKP